MNGPVELWNDSERGGYIQAVSSGHGNCVIQFHLPDAIVAIASTRNRFLSASVGGQARTHFASAEGACEVSRVGDKLQITVQQWRGGKEQIEIDRATFEGALRALAETESPRISLL